MKGISGPARLGSPYQTQRERWGMVRHWLCAAALAAAFSGIATAAVAPPAIDLVLKPHLNAGHVDYVDVRMTVAHPDVAAGASFVHMPLVVASIPTQRYDGDAVKAHDAAGDVP